MNKEEFLNWKNEESTRILELSNMELLGETLLAVGGIDHAYNEEVIWSCNRLVEELHTRLTIWLGED